ncbi:MAG TPA: V-type ATP synthase subunit D [Candidatus Saccharicenans sp.]|jgi:V/A-type H+-transporting ATPase subunit D|nr:V-type ATP synthase subunit D [Candidatus Saccharicenans sp.]HRD01339.1 V-type ATP synthase subunit D [Candidatus Saccharicenans sp.]
MKLKVNPNRMELMRLRRRLTLAERGHKLLKDKLEELMRNFLEAARQFNRIKEEVDEEFRIITRSMAMVRVTQAQSELPALIKDGELQLEVKTGRLLNLTVPEFETGQFKPGDCDFIRTEAELEVALKHFKQLWPTLLEYASLWKKLELLTTEIEVTRRRVNALEYILIPNLKETIHAISSRLEEMERSYQVQLMRVKEIVRQH